MGRITEDVHIHAAPSDVFARLEATSSYGEWLPRAFAEVNGAEGGALSCVLALPLRRERVHLEPAQIEPHSMLHYRAGDGGRAFDSLTWQLSAEGPREVHLELQAVYSPAGGFPGAILDALWLRAFRRQALRDALWRLKQLMEGRAPLDEQP